MNVQQEWNGTHKARNAADDAACGADTEVMEESCDVVRKNDTNCQLNQSTEGWEEMFIPLLKSGNAAPTAERIKVLPARIEAT
jgi:hypothetical protein